MSKKLDWYKTLEAQEHFLGLPKEDREFLKDYKHHIEANKMQVDNILQIDHPFSMSFFNWINSDPDNRKWYLKNINKIKLVPNGIEILWDVYDLEDSIDPNIFSRSVIDQERWYRIAAQKYAEQNWKEIPDWTKVVRFFPAKTWPSFFTDVMKMSRLYLWSSSDTIHSSKNVITFWNALGSTWRLRLVTIKK